MIRRILWFAIMGVVVYLITAVVNRMYQRTEIAAKEAAAGETVEQYTVRIPAMLGAIGLANAGLALLILAVNAAVWLSGGKMGDGMVWFCLIYGSLGILLYVFCHCWRLDVDGDSYVLHRFLRPARRGRFSEITHVREDRWHQLVCYRERRKVVTVNLMSDNRARFDASCVRYGVDMSAIPGADEIIREIREQQTLRGVHTDNGLDAMQNHDEEPKA